MGDFDTVKSITDNLQRILDKQGIKFDREIFDDINKIEGSKLPVGQIFYQSPIFEYSHGQKPEYADLEFQVRVVFKDRSATDSIRDEQEWVQRIRESVTINALNVGDLASSLLVSKVTTEEVEVEHPGDGVGVLNYTLNVRYREL